jgi:hypothetical protein
MQKTSTSSSKITEKASVSFSHVDSASRAAAASLLGKVVRAEERSTQEVPTANRVKVTENLQIEEEKKKEETSSSSEAPSLVTPEQAPVQEGEKAVEPPKKKGGRFGRNALPGTPKKSDIEVECKSPWGKFLRQYKKENPELDPVTATREARKRYVPVSSDGKAKPKSFERIWMDRWKEKNPNWKKYATEERKRLAREAFIREI